MPALPSSPGGLLGADFTIDSGRYKIARIYDNESWNPDLRAPLAGPGVDVAVAGSQKCLGAPPGLAPVAVSARAWQAMERRQAPRGSYRSLLDWKQTWLAEQAMAVRLSFHAAAAAA